MLEQNGRTARQRGYGIRTGPGINGIIRNGCGKFGGNRLRARSLHAPQHLSEREVERTKISLPALIIMRRMISGLCVFVSERAGARMPSRMHERAVLRDQQQKTT